MRATLPEGQPDTFRVSVHGTVFGDRAALIDQINEGERLVLIPDPPLEDEPLVWVHVASGDTVGHLPPEISAWLAVWLLRRGLATATVVRVHGAEVPSWKRLILEVHCVTEESES